MTDHVSGEGSYIECDWFSVVAVTPYEDYDEKFRPENNCYCGADAVQIARVGFHTRLDDPEEETWPRSFSQDVKAHRCEEHGFEEDG